MTLVTLEFPFRAILKNCTLGVKTDAVPGNVRGWAGTHQYEPSLELQLFLACIVRDEVFAMPFSEHVVTAELLADMYPQHAHFTNEMLQELVRAFPKLQTLSLLGWTVQTSSIEELKVLRLGGLHIDYPRLRDAQFWSFVSRMPLKNVSIHGKVELGEPCPNQLVHFSWWQPLASVRSCKNLGASMPNLDGLSLRFSETSFTLEHLRAFLDGATNVKAVLIDDRGAKHRRRFEVQALGELAQKHSLESIRYYGFDAFNESIYIKNGVLSTDPDDDDDIEKGEQ